MSTAFGVATLPRFEVVALGVDELRLQWRNRWGRLAPAHLSRALLFRAMAYRIQAEAFGDLDRQIARRLDRLAQEAEARKTGGAGVVDGSHPPARSQSKAIGRWKPPEIGARTVPCPRADSRLPAKFGVFEPLRKHW